MLLILARFGSEALTETAGFSLQRIFWKSLGLPGVTGSPEQVTVFSCLSWEGVQSSTGDGE